MTLAATVQQAEAEHRAARRSLERDLRKARRALTRIVAIVEQGALLNVRTGERNVTAAEARVLALARKALADTTGEKEE